ncbi:MAG: CehA/McbA family metallohydrolase [Candidatus Bathyarchaeia archaeon]
MSNENCAWVKVDLHVHTICSRDSLISFQEIIPWAKRRGLNAVAITDHNTIDGLSKISKEADFIILPGVEISSCDGHIVALNVSQNVPRGLTAEETVERIHALGGIAVACHPFAPFKGSLRNHVNNKFDAVEVINASAFPFKRSTKKAEEIAERFKLPQVAGTDAHYAPAIGYAYTVVDADLNVDSIIDAIIHGRCKPAGTSLPVTLKLKKQYLHVVKKIAAIFR